MYNIQPIALFPTMLSVHNLLLNHYGISCNQPSTHIPRTNIKPTTIRKGPKAIALEWRLVGRWIGLCVEIIIKSLAVALTPTNSGKTFHVVCSRKVTLHIRTEFASQGRQLVLS